MRFNNSFSLPPSGHKDKLAGLMDNAAIPLWICLTNTPILMKIFAEFMHAFTVILRCDGALLWRINFPLKLLFSNSIS
ncbi:MAG TPA: hypothetical protein DC012_08980 [Escherichia sp.]|nr:hypothetical protein [Escherichia sp.]